MRAFMENGFEVSIPSVAEVYDLVVRDPITHKFSRVQVKTVRIREDRDNAIVIYARKGNGQAYTPDEVDIIAGVSGNKVYLTECTGNQEYWSTQTSAAKRWMELSANTEVM